MLRAKLASRGVAATVASAGLVTEDRPASKYGIEAMARRDIDISGHRSQRLSFDLVGRANLVIGMERQHVREVAVLDPQVFGVTFTLPELARRLTAQGPRTAAESVDAYLRRSTDGRRPTDLLRDEPHDEVDDPYGRSAREYEATAVEIEALLHTVMIHLYPAGLPV